MRRRATRPPTVPPDLVARLAGTDPRTGWLNVPGPCRCAPCFYGDPYPHPNSTEAYYRPHNPTSNAPRRSA